MNLNLYYLRKIFEQIGGYGSFVGGILGYGIGLVAQSNCSDYATLNGACPDPLIFAVVGAIPGLFTFISAQLTRLFK